MGLSSSKCTSTARLDGKTALITGANTGIGKCTAEDFYLRGAHVIIACRNLEKAKEAVDDIKTHCKDKENVGTIATTRLDLSSLKSVRECARQLLESEEKINILVNNAGVMATPLSRTEDGFEMQIGTNHLGHFLFTILLLPIICKSMPARIVSVSSKLHKGDRIDLVDLNWEKKPYNRLVAYQQSKMANILFTKELARALKANNITGVTTYSLHPGVINSDLSRNLSPVLGWFYRNILGLFMKSPEQGAQTSIYCSVDEKCANETGLYYAECAVRTPHVNALNEEDAQKLWDLSWKLVQLDENYSPFPQV